MIRNEYEAPGTKMFAVNLHITIKLRFKLSEHIKKYKNFRFKAGFESNLGLLTSGSLTFFLPKMERIMCTLPKGYFWTG